MQVVRHFHGQKYVTAENAPIRNRRPDFDSLKIPFFLRSDNQYIVKSADFSWWIASPFRAFERSFVHRCKQVGWIIAKVRKVLIHNKLADKAKVRLPTFSHNLHLAAHHIFLIFNNIYQITTRRLFDSIQFCVYLIPRNAPHFFVSSTAIPVNRWLTECISSVKPRLLPDKLLILNNLSVKSCLFTDKLSI